MFVSGFSFVRNAVKLDYPVVEAMLSILPLVDEFVMVVGNSDDATLELINSIGDSKIRIVHSIWDDSLRQGGRVLAEETNKALAAINPKADWAIYIQGDECIHEKYYPVIQRAMNKYKDDTQVEGLLFKYLHFYGSFDFVADSRKRKCRANERPLVRGTCDVFEAEKGSSLVSPSINILRIDPIAWDRRELRIPMLLDCSFYSRCITKCSRL